jgi:hypothetical protein
VPEATKTAFRNSNNRAVSAQRSGYGRSASGDVFGGCIGVRCVEDITEALWGVKVCASTVSDLNQKIYDQIEDWRNKTLKREYTYVYLGWDVAEAQLERRSTQRHRAYRHWSESAWFS